MKWKQWRLLWWHNFLRTRKKLLLISSSETLRQSKFLLRTIVEILNLPCQKVTLLCIKSNFLTRSKKITSSEESPQLSLCQKSTYIKSWLYLRPSFRNVLQRPSEWTWGGRGGKNEEKCSATSIFTKKNQLRMRTLERKRRFGNRGNPCCSATRGVFDSPTNIASEHLLMGCPNMPKQVLK